MLKKVIKYVLIFLICLIICSIGWAFRAYDIITFDEIIFHLNFNLTKSGSSVLFDYFLKGFVPTVVLFFFILFLFKKIDDFVNGHNILIDIDVFKKSFNFKFDENKSRKFFVFLTYLLLILILIFNLYKLGLFTYIKNQMQKSTFIEKNYVDPKKVNLEFPTEKRNLVYIFVESFETSYMSSDLGGLEDRNLLFNLTDLMNENINFSNSNKFGGAYQVNCLGWTAAGMVAQTAGIPLKIPGSIANSSHFKEYLPGVYSLGDVLEKEGYNQELLLGSNASFGNRGIYFKTHGNYNIYDYKTAIKKKKISKDYFRNWGFEDSKLFDIAKEEITNLSNKGKPFNFMTLTTMTHFPNGFVEDTCENKYEDDYSNAIDCSSKQLSDFVNWIKEQDFYDNTTIVIVGDHLTMQAGFFEDEVFDKRTVFNLFINSAAEEKNSKERNFTVMDFYPTTLASLGVKIDGDKLGLGVNLFSDEQTLLEKYGFKKVDEEFAKVSAFYNKKLLK
ncbi:MAG: LTA synthase family protein [Bacilli bacterium]|nr:LTA synthase family protein [Bacilli bacterium]